MSDSPKYLGKYWIGAGGKWLSFKSKRTYTKASRKISRKGIPQILSFNKIQIMRWVGK